MPAIAASVEALPVNNVVLDGELAAVDAKGQPAFFELPPALGAPTRVKGRLVYYTFDMLYLDGFDLRGVALIDRKRVLETLLFNTSGVQLVKYVEHIEGDGAVVLKHACRLGLKGIVSKLAEAPYRSGRSRNWIKTKCTAWRYTNRTPVREDAGALTIPSTATSLRGTNPLDVWRVGSARREIQWSSHSRLLGLSPS